MHTQWRRMATGLLLFGISFGYVEVAVVVYLRTIYDPIRIQVNPKRVAGDLFPLITNEQLRARAPERARLLGAEVVREAATLLMLSGVALAAAGNGKLWRPAFALAFGIWDLFIDIPNVRAPGENRAVFDPQRGGDRNKPKLGAASQRLTTTGISIRWGANL